MCKEKGIYVVFYSFLGSMGGFLMSVELVVKIVEKKGVSVFMVFLSYYCKFGYF